MGAHCSKPNRQLKTIGDVHGHQRTSNATATHLAHRHIHTHQTPNSVEVRTKTQDSFLTSLTLARLIHPYSHSLPNAFSATIPRPSAPARQSNRQAGSVIAPPVLQLARSSGPPADTTDTITRIVPNDAAALAS